MTANNLHNATKLHLYMQMFELQRLASEKELLEAILCPPQFSHGLQPKSLHITVRQADWWDWERGEPLRLDEKHIQDLLDMRQLASVSKFTLELETDESKKDELSALVEVLRDIKGNSYGDRNTFVCSTPPRYWYWTRSLHLDDKDWPIFEGKSQLHLHVAELTWRNVSPTAPSNTTPLPPKILPPTRHWNMALVSLAEARNSIRRNQLARSTAFEHGLWRLAMQRRHQVAELSAEQWKGLGLEYQGSVVWSDSVALAERQMGVGRKRFEGLVGEWEAGRLVRGWEEKGSLLRFEERGSEGEGWVGVAVLDVGDEYPKIPWRAIAGMRDRLIHDYFGVNYKIVWDVARNQLPLLAEAINDLLQRHDL